MEQKFTGKVCKGIQEYSNIMCKDPLLKGLQGKRVSFQIIAVEEITEKPGATITELKKVN
jgi:hypothetical protein